MGTQVGFLILQAELVFEAVSMKFHRLLSHAQKFRKLFDGTAFFHEVRHLNLPVGEI